MKDQKPLLIILIALLVISCNPPEKKPLLERLKRAVSKEYVTNIPIDKGFSEYIEGYTSGIVPSNAEIEIRFTPEFAARADKSATGLFDFDPSIRGRTEWKDDLTLVFIPSKLLDQGKTYLGGLNMEKLAAVEDRLRVFPLRIRTVKKDFVVSIGELACTSQEGTNYILNGQIITSDIVDPREAENYLRAKLGRKKLTIDWDHSDNLIHRFIVKNIERGKAPEELMLGWDGSSAGVRQKGVKIITVPALDEFSVLDVIVSPGESQKIDVVFSDPLDPSQETEGLIQMSPRSGMTISISSNVASLIPSGRLSGKVTLDIESSIKNTRGSSLSESMTRELDFTPEPPGIKTEGNGVILPSSKNLIFPFRAANLKAVDLRIIRIFDDNLPYFLQENDLSTSNSIKRFGRPVYSGRVDLVTGPGINSGTYNLYSIDLSDYINVEPGVLYKVNLGMRRSYSLYPCSDSGDSGKYEELLRESEEKNREFWDDPDSYYYDEYDDIYYSFNFDWRDRENPCKDAYYYPGRGASRNVLASNIGLIAKKGEDNILHVMANDLITAMPFNGVTVEVYDFQMQKLSSATTNQNGSADLYCERKPFIIISKNDKDRNYLKVNDGSSLSLSSFDVTGSIPENGIKAFIYGERDVWRPGDSIFLSIFIKDMISDLPPDHPVEFELINPLEQKIDNQVRKTGGSNLLVFATRTGSDAITGNYRAVFRIGGAVFTKRIRVETIKPNRLKLALNFPEEILGGSESEAHGTLNVRWLNGSPAKSLRASVEYLFRHTKTTFDKYGQYIFDDPATDFYSESVNIFKESTDGSGNAKIIFKPGRDIHAPGMLNAVFTVKASEPGGDESVTQKTYKYAPYPIFVGINLPGLKGKDRMLYTDKDNEVRIVTVDENGKPVRSDVEINIYKISYRWWWESDNENLGYFISRNEYKPIITKTISTAGGEGSFKFNIGKKDWGRYLVRATAPSGHSTGKILLVDWPWEYGMKGKTDGATLVAVSTDKEKYHPGDEVELSFPAPEESRVIVTLENASGVLDEIRSGTGKGNTIIKFTAKPEMAPNVYAYVTIIQPHAQTLNDMPVRLYGIVPVMVEDPETRLSPVISMPDELRSQKLFTINVSEKNKRPMSYTVAIVDEGLLDLTGFRTPDPWDYFYAREALGVKTWDIYDYVLGAFGGTLEKIFAIGGDEALIDKSANKARRFEPVVRFLGPFTLPAGKTNIHAIVLPNYTGSVKAMVVAGSDKAFGAAEKSVPVKDPLMIIATAPRVVSPGENVALPLTLFIQKEGITNVEVKAAGNDLVSFRENTLNIPIKGTGEKDTELAFSVGQKTGTAHIDITATGNGEKAEYSLSVEVRSPNPPERRSELKVLEKGEKWETTFSPFGIKGSNSASIEISALPSINLGNRIDYLVNYPYGCSEQITSAAFPQLWLKELAGNDAAIVAGSSDRVSDAISKLTSRQMADGGMALWPGSLQADNWVTSYAGHFMIEAERVGYSIPSGFKQKWLSFQKRTAQNWHFDPVHKQTATDQAYRLFTLALAGSPDKGAMNRLRETGDIPGISRWLLAAAYARTGRPEVASGLLDVRNTSPEPEYSGFYYGSEIRDKAVILYTLTLLNNKEQALPLLKEICASFNSDAWYSTQSVAWGLFSYMKWVETQSGDQGAPCPVTLIYNGERSEHNIEPKECWSEELKIADGKNTVSVQNGSDRPVYVNLIRKGIPLRSDIEREEKGLSMKIDYLDMKMRPLDQRNLEQGTGFMMVARISNNTFTRVDNIALTQMVPSGWEIQNTRLFEAVTGIRESSFDYRDFRDDRVNTYFSLDRGETRTYVLILNAAYKGEFYQPSQWCEAMYRANCYSRIPGNEVRVTGSSLE
jgi:uncharacterized protein YfaS (alpha-2-macroglobulin family)